MAAVLASAWRPRNDGHLWAALWPLLRELYESVVIVTPPDADLRQIRALSLQVGVSIGSASRPFWTRYECVQGAAATGADHIHYADADRLLHWLATNPDDWRAAALAIQRTDFLIIGRNDDAMASHPRALRDTEAVINTVGGLLLGRTVDLGGGNRGMSSAAAQVVLANSEPGRYGDAEWPILVQRAGMRVDYVAADLQWETPDHNLERIADPDQRQQMAAAYDQRPDRWATRLRTAHEIVQEALAAAQRPLVL